MAEIGGGIEADNELALRVFVAGLETAWSKHYLRVYSRRDGKTCLTCLGENGKIFLPDEPEDMVRYAQQPYEIGRHANCRCVLAPVRCIQAGKATMQGLNGSDFWLRFTGKLPEYYISREEAKMLGWKITTMELAKAAPGKMLAGGIFTNNLGKLPEVPGRIWYEADLHYTAGIRGKHRIVYSNDGLIFVSYDHYDTFIEIL